MFKVKASHIDLAALVADYISHREFISILYHFKVLIWTVLAWYRHVKFSLLKRRYVVDKVVPKFVVFHFEGSDGYDVFVVPRKLAAVVAVWVVSWNESS